MNEGIPAFVPPRGQPSVGVLIDKELVEQSAGDSKPNSPCELVFDEGRVTWTCGKKHVHRT